MIRLITNLASLIILSFTIAYSQNVGTDWVTQVGGTFDGYGSSLTEDINGDIITVGVFSGSGDFDKGTGVTYLSSNGVYDVFVQKMDSLGDFLWAKSVGGANYDFGNSVTTDSLGNIYVTGRFEGTVDFDPGNGNQSLVSAGTSDIFILKLNSQGDFVWVKQVGNPNYNVGESLYCDNLGHILITGYFIGTADFDPGTGVHNLASNTGTFFIQKLDWNGNFVWAKNMGSYYSTGKSIVTDVLGNIYTSGRFKIQSDFDPSGDSTILTPHGDFDVFIQKLDSAGNFLWAKNFGGNLETNIGSHSVDGFGNIIMTGSFQSVVDFDPNIGVNNITSHGEEDIFILKLNNAGEFQWVKGIGSKNKDAGNSVMTNSIGEIYLTGEFIDTVDFNPNNGEFIGMSTGQNEFGDLFVEKLDSLGEFKWVKTFGGNKRDVGFGLTVHSSNNLFVTGIFQGASDFDPGLSVMNLISNGGSDGFILKLNSCNELIIDTTVVRNGLKLYAQASGAFYQWIDCDNLSVIADSINPYVVTQSGNYALKVHQFGCIDTSNCITFINVGIESSMFDQNIKVYPNPTEDYINIEFEQLIQNTIKVDVFDFLGHKVIEQSVKLIDGTTLRIDLQKLTTGIYFVKVFYEKKEVLFKISKL